MMKKTGIISIALLLTFSLVGCDDARAKLKDANQAVVTIDGKKITKGQIYASMFAAVGQTTAVNDAMRVITDAEVETTDDMMKEAQSTLDYYKSNYGQEKFASYLRSTGMTEDEFVNTVVLPSQKEKTLYSQYALEQFTSLAKHYNPFKATILTFTNKDDASAAIAALKDGAANVADVIQHYSLSSKGESELITIDTTTYDSAALTYLRSASSDDGWQMIPAGKEGTYYVVHLDSRIPDDFRDEFTEWAAQQTAVQTEAKTYYFQKYNFHVYDIDLYNAIKSVDPNILVQDKQASPTPEATETPMANQ